MTKLDDDRRMRLRRSYLDRIIEVAQHYAATNTYFIEADFKSFIADEFTYLTELTEEEQQYLRDQAALESLRRVATSRAKDREELFRQLIADNPDIVVHYADFAFDLGWIDLVKDAVARMRTYPAAWKVRLDGATERFGCLVLHVSFVVAERGATAEIKRMREEIRLRSLATCEICGSQGRLRLGSWAKTVCDKHSAVLEEFQEDDGRWADPWRWLENKQVPEDHIADVVSKGRALMAPVEAEKDPARMTEIGRRIDNDTRSCTGRQQELLIEFTRAIEDVVNGATVKAEYLDDYIAAELGGWRTTAVVPVSDRDREFLHAYVRELIDAEYERVKARAAERNAD
jgi:hypothetical protein